MSSKALPGLPWGKKAFRMMPGIVDCDGARVAVFQVATDRDAVLALVNATTEREAIGRRTGFRQR